MPMPSDAAMRLNRHWGASLFSMNLAFISGESWLYCVDINVLINSLLRNAWSAAPQSKPPRSLWWLCSVAMGKGGGGVVWEAIGFEEPYFVDAYGYARPHLVRMRRDARCRAAAKRPFLKF